MPRLVAAQPAITALHAPKGGWVLLNNYSQACPRAISEADRVRPWSTLGGQP